MNSFSFFVLFLVLEEEGRRTRMSKRTRTIY